MLQPLFDSWDEQDAAVAQRAAAYQARKHEFEGWPCPGCGAPMRVQFGAGKNFGVWAGVFCSAECYPGSCFSFDPFSPLLTDGRIRERMIYNAGHVIECLAMRGQYPASKATVTEEAIDCGLH